MSCKISGQSIEFHFTFTLYDQHSSFKCIAMFNFFIGDTCRKKLQSERSIRVPESVLKFLISYFTVIYPSHKS